MSEKLEVSNFKMHRFSISAADNGTYFEHNYDRDLHLFVLWQDALGAADDVVADLGTTFSIRAVADANWSKYHVLENSNRLYQRVHLGNRVVPEKIGSGRLSIVLVEDKKPRYTYARSISGLYECINRKIVDHKYRYRSWFGSEYAVHSTNSLKEFFQQAPLLLGPDRLSRILSNEDASLESSGQVLGDTTGVAGWSDFKQLFQYLELTTNYIVLRGFEGLPFVEPRAVQEIDFLCDDLPSFLAALNASVHDLSRPYKATIRVGGVNVRVDARYVGDGYYDSRWQTHLLTNQVPHAGVVKRPRYDDHFFALLYHAKIQKEAVSSETLETLVDVGKTIGLTQIKAEDIRSDDVAAGILTGFMNAQGYRYARPVDSKVISRRSMLKRMHKVALSGTDILRSTRSTSYRILSRLIPGSIKSLVPHRWKRSLAQRLQR